MNRIHIMALRHSAFYAPLLMTVAGGCLREEGLEASYDVATPERPIPASLAAGTCQVAQSAVATSFAALERGEAVDVVHFAQINQRDGFFLAAREAQSGFSWQRLAGRRVLVDHFFQPLAFFRDALARQGMAPSDIEVIDAGGPEQMEAAFRAGTGDYVHLQGPAPQQLERDGIGHVVAAVGEAVGPVAFSSLCARRDWLATDAARAFMRAYRRGRERARRSPPAEVAAVLAEAGYFPGIDRQALTQAVQAYQRLGCWDSGAEISRAAYERLLDVFQSGGLITRRHGYEAAVVPPPEP